VVGIGAPPPLTVRFAADRLTGLKLRWLEDPLTIATPPFDHTGVVALKGQAKNLEAVIECVLRPRRWLSPNNKTWKGGCFIPLLTPTIYRKPNDLGNGLPQSAQ
jgi:hypothetical protein